jgi:hypothetical protein
MYFKCLRIEFHSDQCPISWQFNVFFPHFWNFKLDELYKCYDYLNVNIMFKNNLAWGKRVLYSKVMHLWWGSFTFLCFDILAIKQGKARGCGYYSRFQPHFLLQTSRRLRRFSKSLTNMKKDWVPNVSIY